MFAAHQYLVGGDGLQSAVGAKSGDIAEVQGNNRHLVPVPQRISAACHRGAGRREPGSGIPARATGVQSGAASIWPPRTFRKLAVRQNPHNAALWYNIGICDASAGEEVPAVRFPSAKPRTVGSRFSKNRRRIFGIGPDAGPGSSKPRSSSPSCFINSCVPSVDKRCGQASRPATGFCPHGRPDRAGVTGILFIAFSISPWRDLSWETLAIRTKCRTKSPSRVHRSCRRGCRRRSRVRRGAGRSSWN